MRKIKDENQAFIKSNKVVRQQLGVKEADVLATLVYKADYWRSQGKLTHKDGKDWFFISRDDIRAETTYSVSVITKTIQSLVKAGLVKMKRQGCNKPNLYNVDMAVINVFIDSHSKAYENWKKEVYGKSILQISKAIEENELSEKVNIDFPNNQKLSSTKNKITNNISTNNTFTNQASLVSEMPSKFEDLVLALRSVDDVFQEKVIVMEIFNMICQWFKPFEKFKISEKDSALISQLGESEIPVYNIAYKIEYNAMHIQEGGKSPRFGSLFVGVEEMINNYGNVVV